MKGETNVSYDNFKSESISKEEKVLGEEKPFKCVLCEKCYKRKQKLIAHITLVHEGKKPFKCQICSKSFANQYYIKFHIAYVNEGKKKYE